MSFLFLQKGNSFAKAMTRSLKIVLKEHYYTKRVNNMILLSYAIIDIFTIKELSIEIVKQK